MKDHEFGQGPEERLGGEVRYLGEADSGGEGRRRERDTLAWGCPRPSVRVA